MSRWEENCTSWPCAVHGCPVSRRGGAVPEKRCTHAKRSPIPSCDIREGCCCRRSCGPRYGSRGDDLSVRCATPGTPDNADPSAAASYLSGCRSHQHPRTHPQNASAALSQGIEGCYGYDRGDKTEEHRQSEAWDGWYARVDAHPATSSIAPSILSWEGNRKGRRRAVSEALRILSSPWVRHGPCQ